MFEKRKNRESKKGNQLASRVKKDQEQEIAWIKKNTQEISTQYADISHDSVEQLKIIEHYKILESKTLDFYKSYLEGRAQSEKTNVLESDIQPEDSSNFNKNIPFDIQEVLNSIEDFVVKKLVEGDLQFSLASLPREVTEISKLKENLSLWNEHIERVEAKQIAYLGLTNFIDLDLSVIASVNHESQNTKVSLMRRTLKKMADKSALLTTKFDNLSSMTRGDRNKALEKLIKVLKSHYEEPKNREDALKSMMVTLQTQQKRKALKRSGWLLAISKIPSAVIFTLGVAGLITGFPPFQIAGGILLGVTLALKLPSFLIQFGIGKKKLPEVDYSAEMSGKYNQKEINSLESSIGISLEDIRGVGADDFFEHACGNPNCDLEQIEAEDPKNNRKIKKISTDINFDSEASIKPVSVKSLEDNKTEQVTVKKQSQESNKNKLINSSNYTKMTTISPGNGFDFLSILEPRQQLFNDSEKAVLTKIEENEHFTIDVNELAKENIPYDELNYEIEKRLINLSSSSNMKNLATHKKPTNSNNSHEKPKLIRLNL